MITLLQLEWEATTKESISKLVNSMPRRLEACRLVDGRMTGY